VVAGDVEGVLAREPFIDGVAEESRLGHGRDVAGEHVGLWRESRDGVAVLEVQVEDDLDQHWLGIVS